MAQLVKNPPAMQETWVQLLGWEDPRRRERPPTPVFWPEELDTTEGLSLSTFPPKLEGYLVGTKVTSGEGAGK